ncbi:MAG: 2-oxoacid:acceptor oxidoreductase family protein, partial [Ruminococcus flavefaciens]
MKEIIWLGRGGQGAFTAAKLLGAAYTSDSDDKYALAFPSFGPERRGAPVRAFTKLDGKPVTDRSQTEKADYIVILD